MKCWFRRLYIYPGLPNATSVQQETDLNYGPFKFIVLNNLKEILSAFYAVGIPIPPGMSTFGLIVYSGTILVGTTTISYRNDSRKCLTWHQIKLVKQSWCGAAHKEVLDSQESLTGEDRPRFSGTTNKVTQEKQH
jgi:hypothetical protein